MFSLNPHEVEAVRLSTKAEHASDVSEVLSQFPRAGRPRDLQSTGERTDPAKIRRYTMAVDLSPTGIGEIGFAATTQVDIAADSAVGPWVPFTLFSKLKVASPLPE